MTAKRSATLIQGKKYPTEISSMRFPVPLSHHSTS
jgi:hypothetical protein